MTDETKGPKNTKAQIDFINAQEEAWEIEQKWPLYQVVITGDEVDWSPRPDPMYWQVEDPDDPRSVWIPLDEKALPDHAHISDNGQVAMKARATVQCRAKTEELAKMFALRANPGYDTVESVKEIKGD